MAKIISASINLSKIDKSKIVEGAKGKYYNILITCNDEKDQYGHDVSISEGQTKEQRTAKEKKNYIGNGKTIWEGEYKNSEPTNQIASSTKNEDDLPF